MKTNRIFFALFAHTIVILAGGTSLLAQPVGQWDFENGDLSATVGGAALQYLDGAGGATQTGTQFGTTTALGIPDIGGAVAKAMKFPAGSTPSVGYNMPTPAATGGSLVNTYTIIFDVLYPASANNAIRPLLQTSDGTGGVPQAGLGIAANNAVGAIPNVLLGGQVATNTWYRIGFVRDLDTMKQSAYINGVQVAIGNISSDDVYSLTASSFAQLFNNSAINTAQGYVNSIQLRDVALSAKQMLAMGGPTAAGIPQVIPPIPSSIEKWIPRGSVANRNTDIGAIIDAGSTTIADASITLKLDGVTQASPSITRQGTQITVVKPNPGLFPPGTHHTNQIIYTDSLAGAKTNTHEFTAAIFFEDFEDVILGPSVDEAVAEHVWSKDAPGWVHDDSGVPGIASMDTDGVTEWAGWSFANRDWWVSTAGDQRRSEFISSSGVVAIADADEWDDRGHDHGLYNTYVTSPAFPLAGIPANTMFIKFVSSWRDECCDDAADLDNSQTATVTITFDGGTPVELMKWDSTPGSPFFHDDFPNETVLIRINNPAGATNAVVTFGLSRAENDWWWAFDNVEVNGGAVTPIFDKQPVGGIVSVNDSVTFTASASGTEPLSYQWRLNGTNIAGATSTNLTLTSVQSSQAGDYDVVVSNVAGSVPSAVANLKVARAPLSQDLVLHLKLDGNADDTSGRTNNGTINGAPDFVAGKVGSGAIHIGSPSDFVSLGAPADLNFGTAIDCSIAFWAQAGPDPIDPTRTGWRADPCFVSNKNWDSGANPAYVIAINGNGSLQWDIAGTATGQNGNRYEGDGPAGTFNDYLWHHCVITFERSGLGRMYIDGVLRQSLSIISHGPCNLDTPTDFATNIGQDGRGTYTDGTWSNVTMDDVGIWRRVLTSTEVARIYQTGTNGQDFSTAVVPVQITGQPQGKTIAAGDSVVFSVTATGTAPYSYQWRKDGVAITGANGSTLTIAGAKLTDAGKYSVEVGNMAALVLSSDATLVVNPAADLTAGLVVHLTFDYDLNDSSGHGNNGVAKGNTPLVPGKIGQSAVRFSSNKDGSSFNYVSLGAPADLNFGATTDFSVSFWAKIANWTGDPAFISNKNWDSGGNQGWVIATEANARIQWNIADGDPGGRTRKDYDGPGGTFSDGNWHHIVVTFARQGNGITYVDGVQANSTPIIPDLDSVDTPAGLATNIGQDGRGTYTDGGSVGIADGNLDDLGIWRRILSAQEVADIYHNGQSGIDLTGKSITNALVVHLTFDSDLNDSSGHGNNGVAKGNTPLVPGKIGSSAVRFSSNKDGSSFNYVSLGAPADLNFGTSSDFSVSFWAKIANWTGDPAFISNKNWDSGGNQGWVIATEANARIQWNIADGDAGGRTRKDYDGPGGTFSDGNWHHIAVTFARQGNGITYVDGVQANSTPIIPGLDSVDTPAGLATNIGQDGRGTYTDGGGVGIADGNLDDLGIWRRVLGAQEVADIYHKGQAGIDLAGKFITDDLVVHLKFDSDLNDSSGHGNNGVAKGNTPLVPGKIGASAVRFSSNKDGSSFNYVSLGAPADLNFGTNTDFSVSFWAKIANWTGDPAFISNKNWDSGGNQGWVIATEANARIQWNIADGDSGGRTRKDYDGPAGTFSDGNWHHIVVTFARKSNGITYVDGVQANSTPIIPDLDSVDTPAGLATNIGQDGRGTYTDGGSVGIADGNLDDVGIWRRVLSPAEAAAIYSAGLAGRDLSRANERLTGKITIGAVSQGNVTLTWTGSAGTVLQQSATLSPANWLAVPNTDGASSATVPITGNGAYFRLLGP